MHIRGVGGELTSSLQRTLVEFVVFCMRRKCQEKKTGGRVR